MDITAILQSIYASSAELILLVFACGLLLAPLVSPKINTEVIAYLSILAIILAAVANVYTPQDMSSFNEMFILDDSALFFKYLFYLTTILVILLSIGYLKLKHNRHSEYYVFLLFALCGMMLMVSGTDLLSVYVGIELVALATYILTGFLRHQTDSTEAALKYVILGALSSAILLYGISLFYGLTGTTQLQHIAAALSSTDTTAGANLDNTGLLLATTFLLAGFGFKVAAVPFHMWQPDVYQGAPTPITAFLSVGPKIAGIAVLMRVFMMSFAEQQIIWEQLLTAIAIVTMITGSLVALVQSKIKRLLAYSSISHVGFILLGFLTSTTDGFYAIVFYLSAYAFMNLGAFTIIIALYSSNQDNEDIDDYSGLVHRHPWLATIMALFLFSLAGIPPTAGFIAKFNIIMALIGHQHTVLAILAVIFSVVSAYYYIRIVLVMFMKPAQQKFAPAYSIHLVIVLATTATITLGLGLYPAPLFDIIRQLSP